MSHLKIAATERSPEVDFDFENHRLRLSGESYPEDVAAFYGPVFEAFDRYLHQLADGACVFDFELIYFNSSSAKAIMSLIERLDEVAARGATVTVNWYYDEEDDTMRELGQEFGEDLGHVDFHVQRRAAEG